MSTRWKHRFPNSKPCAVNGAMRCIVFLLARARTRSSRPSGSYESQSRRDSGTPSDGGRRRAPLGIACRYRDFRRGWGCAAAATSGAQSFRGSRSCLKLSSPKTGRGFLLERAHGSSCRSESAEDGRCGQEADPFLGCILSTIRAAANGATARARLRTVL